MDEAGRTLLQYGAIGAILVLALIALVYLARRLLDSLDREIVRLQERNEELNEQLKLQNELIQREVIPVAHSLSQAIQVLPPLIERLVRMDEAGRQRGGRDA
jgi:hypothetical protein